MTEPTLFDQQAEADAARDEAIATVEEHARDDWLGAAGKAIAQLALFPSGSANEFNTDDVWELLASWDVAMPHEPRAMGAAITIAAKAGVIVPTGVYRKSRRKECHAGPKMIWRGVPSDD